MEDERVRIVDDEHLRLLSIAFWIEGGITLLFACFPILYIAMGFAVTQMESIVPGKNMHGPPKELGYVFMGIGALLALVMASKGVLNILTARALQQRRHRMLCMVTAVLSLLSMPYGTVVGVATLIVLSRPTVMRQFGVTKL